MAARKRQPEAATQHAGAGPYSPVLIVAPAEIVAISGQGPIDSDGNIVGDSIQDQTKLALENVRRQLATAGCDLADVWKVHVYLADLGEWHAMNEVYRTFFTEPYPVRTALGCNLLRGMKIEADVIAAKP